MSERLEVRIAEVAEEAEHVKRFEKSATQMITTGTRLVEQGQTLNKLGSELLASLAKVNSNGSTSAPVRQLSAMKTPTPEVNTRQPVVSRPTLVPLDGESVHITGVKQKILDVLAELESIGVSKPNRIQVAFMSGYTSLGSTGFVKAVGRLRAEGLITYPDPKTFQLTDAGAAAANKVEKPTTSEELQTKVLNLLGGTKGKVLQTLLDQL